ncbi:MAG TPA: hypothetical protein VNG12_09065 [Acidimicrobiales bacterium]|nr:hypothetical protein [Acidimicrobiales bacterium]
MRTTPMATRRPWGWFAAWWLIGGLWSITLLGIATVGLFVLPVSLAATALLARRSHGAGALGLLSGLGLPVFYVAYLNRDGPGNVCSSTSSGGQTCVQEWSPWPWLAAAVILSIAGFLLLRYRLDHPKPRSPKLWRPS